MHSYGLKMYSYAFKLHSYGFKKYSHAFKVGTYFCKMQWYTFRTHFHTIEIYKYALRMHLHVFKSHSYTIKKTFARFQFIFVYFFSFAYFLTFIYFCHSYTFLLFYINSYFSHSMPLSCKLLRRSCGTRETSCKGKGVFQIWKIGTTVSAWNSSLLADMWKNFEVIRRIKNLRVEQAMGNPCGE